jgi:hypothetical protein
MPDPGIYSLLLTANPVFCIKYSINDDMLDRE